MPSPPNIVLIVTDDLGYADLGCQGAKQFETPHLDRMAKEGTRYTDFHVTSAQCTPSRASILTGLYPQRLGLEGVLLPGDKHGLTPGQPSLAPLLKASGYHTALMGKWHLGHHPGHLPNDHGFDAFFGIPYSHDMAPLSLFRDRDAVAPDPDPAMLTQQITDESIQWIKQADDTPFMLCLWYPAPHVPLVASTAFRGSSSLGAYGDVVQELDHHIGRIMKTLSDSGCDENTLVLFTSDNGPFQPHGRPDPDYGGSARPLRGAKSNEYEGGLRVPCLLRWPGRVPANKVSDVFWSALDLMPTLAALAGTELLEPVDGFDCRDLWSGESTCTPYEYFYYYHYGRLDGVRSGRWKLMCERRNQHDFHFHYHGAYARPEEARRMHGPAEAVSIGESLFDLESDRGERRNVGDQHPLVRQRLRDLLAKARDDLGDNREGIPLRRRTPDPVGGPR